MNNSLLPPEKKRELNEQQQKFLDALAHEAKGNIKQALAIAGYAETSQSNIVSSLKDEIVEVATKILAKSAPMASSEACRDTYE